jgi:hypothetical protein
MLFMTIILLVTGYTMVYSALHGQWEFWRFFFPAQAPNTTANKSSVVA